jgi:hypothetical protein
VNQISNKSGYPNEDSQNRIKHNFVTHSGQKYNYHTDFGDPEVNAFDPKLVGDLPVYVDRLAYAETLAYTILLVEFLKRIFSVEKQLN